MFSLLWWLHDAFHACFTPVIISDTEHHGVHLFPDDRDYLSGRFAPSLAVLADALDEFKALMLVRLSHANVLFDEEVDDDHLRDQSVVKVLFEQLADDFKLS